MNLVLSSKSDKKLPKMAKTKIVQKNAYVWLSKSKSRLSEETSQDSVVSPKSGLFCHFLIPLHFLMHKD